jgi:hypothetical protein
MRLHLSFNVQDSIFKEKPNPNPSGNCLGKLLTLDLGFSGLNGLQP